MKTEHKVTEEELVRPHTILFEMKNSPRFPALGCLAGIVCVLGGGGGRSEYRILFISSILAGTEEAPRGW